jgi:hypothetical protein
VSARHRLTVSLVTAALFAPALAHGAGGTTAPGVERYQRVVITDRGLSLRTPRIRGDLSAGLIVVFEIRNESRVARRFAVEHYRSAAIPPGATLNASVAFRRAGRVPCSATAARRAPLRASFRLAA